MHIEDFPKLKAFERQYRQKSSSRDLLKSSAILKFNEQ